MKAFHVNRIFLLTLATVIFTSCASSQSQQMKKTPISSSPLLVMNSIAERYVKLVLALGEYDPMYVDAYYGPQTWAKEVKAEKSSMDKIQKDASQMIMQLESLSVEIADETLELRREYLVKQLEAVSARIKMLRGAKMSFDEESKALYDAVAPRYGEGHFEKVLQELDKLIPGKGSLTTRYENYKKAFIIPKEKLKTVFDAAILEARKRTSLHIELPANENFELEFVTNKSWSGYNWYKGNNQSLIQVNTDLPIYIDRAVDLACHEGYPGHHVYNVLLEENMVRKRGWVEFTVYPLFSPQSLIAEGTGNFGIEVAFPGKERVEFERKLFKMAGLDPKKADRYYKILALTAKLNYAGNEAARLYLNGEIDGKQASNWLEKYTLASPERAKQRLRFIDEFRSYVINYNFGQDLVKNYIVGQGGTDSHSEKRWEEFKRLISSPRLPSGLI